MKRGFITLKATMMIVLALFILLAFMPLFNKLLAVFIEEEDKPTIDAFNNIGDTIGLLLQTNEAYFAEEIIISMDPDYALVGFDTHWDNNAAHIQTISGTAESIPKPTTCSTNACLCLYQHNPQTSFSEAQFLDCQVYNPPITFSGITNPEYTDSESFQLSLPKQNYAHNTRITNDIAYEHLYLRKQTPTPTQRVYIEKYIEDDTINIFITTARKIKFNNQLREPHTRGQFMSVCGENSDKECVGKHFNEIVATDQDTFTACVYENIAETCKQQQVTNCPDGKITQTCICSLDHIYNEYDKGYCYNSYYYDHGISCNNFQTCRSYEESKTFKEYCEQDPCGLNCAYMVRMPTPGRESFVAYKKECIPRL